MKTEEFILKTWKHNMRTIEQLINLSGRVAMITGGAGHIGRAAASTLAELGADIVLVDINSDALEQASLELTKEYGCKVLNVVIDMESNVQIESICETITKEFNQLDIVINNAAFVGASGLQGWVTDFANQTVETWRRAIEVNLTAPFSIVQSCLPLLQNSSQPSVINIGSIYGVLGPDMSLYEGTNMGNPAAYAASKGGLTQLTRWLATVLGPNIRVNTISPGGVSRGQDAKFIERYIERTPLKRMATEEDFKGSIAYLASDLSSYVTGQNLIVDGGWSTW